MPRKLKPRECHCGCGGITRGGEYLAGHDQKILGALAREFGGAQELREFVEKKLGRQIMVQSGR